MMRRLWNALTRPRSLGRRPGRARRSRGGIALLVVVTTLLVLTVIISELSYAATVRVMVAYHQRDRVAASWLARSGVNFYRLILTANKQLAKSDFAAQIEQYTGLNLGDALWQMVPTINTGLLRMLFTGTELGEGNSDEEDAAIEDFQQTGRVAEEVAAESREGSAFENRNFLDFDGDFAADITDNESLINVNILSARDTSKSIQDDPTGKLLFALMSGEENDLWFHERNLDRWELIGNLADWVDADNLRSSGLGGYEDNLYNKLDPPYLAKNAAFDTKEEIRMVEGWQDDVFERFGDKLTIWDSGKININTAGDELIKALIRAYVSPVPNDSTLEAAITQLREYMLLTNFKKGKEFATYLTEQGYTVDPKLASVLTNTSTTFTLTSTGVVGDSMATITAVVEYGTRGGTVGKVLYWRED